MLFRHLFAILILPFTVTAVIPWLILRDGDFRILPLTGILGCLLIAAGLSLVVQTVRLFVTVGRGTLAPWDPPRHLVVQGPYRYVRNPMISGVLAILLGEAILLLSPGVLTWLAAFALINMIYMPILEEPGLEERFGEEYRVYKHNVPRWIPRLRPWIPPWDNAS